MARFRNHSLVVQGNHHFVLQTKTRSEAAEATPCNVTSKLFLVHSAVSE